MRLKFGQKEVKGGGFNPFVKKLMLGRIKCVRKLNEIKENLRRLNFLCRTAP